MKAQMTKEILNLIYALHLHRRLMSVDSEIRNQHFAVLRDREKNRDYFKSLPLPEGMTHCEACYEAMYNYPVEKLLDLQENELKNYYFGY